MLRPDGRSWWPGLRVSEAPTVLECGEELALVLRSPIGYRLRIRLSLVDSVPARRLVARSTGDPAGVGALELVDAGQAGAGIRFRCGVSTRLASMHARQDGREVGKEVVCGVRA